MRERRQHCDEYSFIQFVNAVEYSHHNVAN